MSADNITIIPIRGGYEAELAMKEINGRKLLDIALDKLIASSLVSKIVVTTPEKKS